MPKLFYAYWTPSFSQSILYIFIIKFITNIFKELLFTDIGK